jgi:hypothetical protein
MAAEVIDEPQAVLAGWRELQAEPPDPRAVPRPGLSAPP